jgi:hypothetical protein
MLPFFLVFSLHSLLLTVVPGLNGHRRNLQTIRG